MTFIDWSDSEGMLELYQDFVRDEMNGSLADAERQRFLNQILGDVEPIGEEGNTIERRREIRESIQDEFTADPASTHLVDLIQELERLA